MPRSRAHHGCVHLRNFLTPALMVAADRTEALTHTECASNPVSVQAMLDTMGDMKGMKRISMAGSDVAVTEATIADLVLEYAMHLGRAGTTDIVVVPVPGHGSVREVDLLIGPASQIVLSESEDDDLVETPQLEQCRVDLRERIARLTGHSAQYIADNEEVDPLHAFVDFDGYDETPCHSG